MVIIESEVGIICLLHSRIYDYQLHFSDCDVVEGWSGVVGGGGVVGRARGPCRVRVLIVLRPWETLAPPPPTLRAGAPTLLRRKNRKLQPFLVAVTTARLVTMGMTPAPTLPRAPPGTGENRLVKYGVGLTRRSNRYYGDMGLWARKVTRINKPGPSPPPLQGPRRVQIR